MGQLHLDLDLAPVYAVHCFFGCGAVIRSPNSTVGHDDMESHYASVHRRQIDRITGAAPQPSPILVAAPRRTKIVLCDG